MTYYHQSSKSNHEIRKNRIIISYRSCEKYAIDNKLSDNLKDNYVRKQLQKIGTEIESGRWNNSTH